MKALRFFLMFGSIITVPLWTIAQTRIEYNSSNANPQLLLKETANDFARLNYENTTSDSAYWSLMGKIDAVDSLSRFRVFYEGNGSNGAPLVITGDLKLGIGTADPRARLTLKQSSDQEVMGIRLINGAGNAAGKMWMNGNNFHLYSGNNTDNGLTFTTSGRIGAFTDSPGAKFAIYESSWTATEDLFLVSRMDAIDMIIQTVRILEAKEDGDVYIRRLGIREDSPSHQLDVNTDNPDDNPFRLRLQDITKFRVMNNGGTSIGSGNASPPEDGLHVEGQVHIGTNAAGTDRLQVRAEAGENALRVVVDTETKLRVLSNGGTSIGSNNETPPENGLYVNGNLYLGTSIGAPEYKMCVNGKVICEELTVELSGNWPEWPDYVFEPDYNLIPLETVHEYIQKHKHLPGIPSAAEIDAEGIQMSKSIIALLEKVEEITLYTIQQEKRIKELEAQVETIVNNK